MTSAEEAAIKTLSEDDYDGPESLRGVELVPKDAQERFFFWQNNQSVYEAHMKNCTEHPRLLELEATIKKGKEEIATLEEVQELMDDNEDAFLEECDVVDGETFLDAKKKVKRELEWRNREAEESRKKARTMAMIETIKIVNDQFKLGVKHI